MPPPETYKSEIGSQSTKCQVHTGSYVSLLEPGKTDYTACHPKKTTTYILHDYHVYITRSIYHYAYARQTQVNWKKETKKKKEDKGKESKEKKAKKKTKKERKEKKRKYKESKKRPDNRRKQGKEKRRKMSY